MLKQPNKTVISISAEVKLQINKISWRVTVANNNSSIIKSNKVCQNILKKIAFYSSVSLAQIIGLFRKKAVG